jgi:hypothetical protein
VKNISISCQSQPSALRQIDVGKVGGRDKHKKACIAASASLV